jgi:hypothetical protein
MFKRSKLSGNFAVKTDIACLCFVSYKLNIPKNYYYYAAQFEYLLS